VERDHRRPPLGIRQAFVEQAEAPFAVIAHAPRDAGEERNQRRLDGVRQHVRRVVAAAQFARHAAPPFPIEQAVGERQLDDVADLRHRAVHRRDPWQRGDCERLAARRELGQQGLGHHRVADPLRRDDEGA